jgi:hypothetical protein
MVQTIMFEFDLEKFVAAMAYMASKVSDLTPFRAAKLVYFADKFHLTRYGRPVIGDWYVSMDHGPVPSQAYDLMQELMSPLRVPGVSRPTQDRLRQFLGIQQGPKHPRFIAKREPDYSVLSESDLEALDKAISRFGAASVSQVWRAGHSERTWKETKRNQRIDYRLFFDESNPQQRAVLEQIEEGQETEAFLASAIRH